MSNNIIVYSKPGCGHCQFTKKYLDKLGLDYQERDVERDAKSLQEVKDLGYSSLPVVVAEGHEAFNGFRPDKLDMLVK